MADATKVRLSALGILHALITLVSGTNDDGTAYGGARVQVVSSAAPSSAVAATPTEVASGTTDVQGVGAAAGLRLLGYAVRETGGAGVDAIVILRHGTLISDPILANILLSGDQGDVRWFGDRGIACANGIFLDRTGTAQITFYTATS